MPIQTKKYELDVPLLYQPLSSQKGALAVSTHAISLPQCIVTVSPEQDVVLNKSEHSRPILSESGVFSNIQRVFLHHFFPKPQENDAKLDELLAVGQSLHAKALHLQQVDISTARVSLTKKQIFGIGCLTLGGVLGGAIWRLWPQEDHRLSDLQFFGSSNNSDIYGHEYEGEIDAINRLTDVVHNEMVHKDIKKFARHKRSYNDVIIKNKYIPNEIFKLSHDETIDWQYRNEFDLIFRRAETSSYVKQAISKNEKNIKLLVECIRLVFSFMEENGNQFKNNKAYKVGKFYLKSLFNIVHGLSNQNKRAVFFWYQKIDDLSKSNYTLFMEKPIYINKRIYLPNKKEAISSTTDHVDIKPLTRCRDERENLTTAGIMKLISNVLKRPASTMIEESRVVINYNINGIGCVDNKDFDDIAKKIESVIDSLLSWVPVYSRGRLITLILASLLEKIADAINNKDLSVKDTDELDSYVRNLAKDLVSSVLSRGLAEHKYEDAIDEMMKDVEIGKNKIYVNIKNENKKIEIAELANHFSDIKTKGYVFYNAQKKWILNDDINFNQEIKRTISKMTEFFNDEKNTYFLQNNSPEIYGDCFFIKHESGTYVLIEDEILPVFESEVSKDVFRYTAKSGDDILPIVTRGNSWVFEDKNTQGVSDDIITLLMKSEYIKFKLVSRDINHNDVSPMTLTNKLQYDKNNNQYIKVDNKYYLIKTDANNYQYISGQYDILPLKITTDTSGALYQYADLAATQFRGKLDSFAVNENEPSYYLDKKIIDEILKKPSWYEKPNFQNDDGLFYESPKALDISGSLRIKNMDYISYKGRLMRITSRGDDTYILGDPDNIKDCAIIYKNIISDTYYLFSKINNHNVKKRNYNLRTLHCISKRQILSLCSSSFYETMDISALLKKNKNHGVTISEPDKTLSRHSDINGFYKNGNGDVFYRSQEGLFFHAIEKKSKHSPTVPVYFKLYGKNKDGSINKEIKITPVSIIKDFDSKKFVVSTPIEARESIFDLDDKMAKKLFMQEKKKSRRRDMVTGDAAEISTRLAQNNNMVDVFELFERSGKKIVSSIKNIDAVLPIMKEKYFGARDEIDFISLSELGMNPEHSVLYSIYDEAFHKAETDLKKTFFMMKNNGELFDNYVSNRINIKDKKAAEIFINSFLKKINRMHFILDDKNRDNIMLIMRNKSSRIRNEDGRQVANKEGDILGITDVHDPLDRVFINSDIISPDLHSIGNDFYSFQKKEKYINLASTTMLHEAVHAIGLPNDYIYIKADRMGNFVSIENSISQIKNAIAKGELSDDDFSNLCKLYFMSNPVYKGYSLESLLKPTNLAHAFETDDYFKGIVLINNPDSVSQIISDFSKQDIVQLNTAN